jgi:membrane-associated phospholipid phosphatase
VIRGGFKPADTLTITFGLLLFAVVLLFFNRIEAAASLLVLYAGMAAFQLALVYLSRMNRFLSLTRDVLFPILCVIIFFDSLELLVHRINPQDIDYLLIRLDYDLLGCYPTVYLERFSYPVFIDALQIAYSTYYFIPVAMGLALKARSRHKEFDKYIFVVLFCFYLSFIGYMFFPALGPRYSLQHLQTRGVDGLLVSGVIQDTLNALEGVKRDAFPSGHTAVVLVVLYYAFRYDRRFACVITLPVVLLIAATVFCRYHYVVDLIGGVILAVVSVALGELYYRRWEGRDNGPAV